MRIVVPHTHISRETVISLLGAASDWEVIDVSGSDTAYFDLLNQLWTAGDEFALVEQDIVVRPSTFASFERCPNPWCAAPYPYLGSSTYAGLGCTRFRSEILAAHPDLMDDVALHNYEGHCPKHWCTLDAAIQRELGKRGRHVCLRDHLPVGHLHDTPTHGCCG